MALAPTSRLSPELQFGSLFREAESLAGQMERGNANAPLGKHFQLLSSDMSDTALAMGCMPFTAGARAALLNWIVEDEVFSADTLPNETPPLSIATHAGSWDIGDANPVEYGDAVQFSAAIAQVLTQNKAIAASVIAHVPERGELRGVRFVVAPPVGGSIGLHNCYARVADMLLVVAPVDFELTQEHKELLREAADTIAGIWPIVTPAESESAQSTRTCGWWDDAAFMRAAVKLPPLLLNEPTRPMMPAFLHDANNPTRRVLRAARVSKRCQMASEALADVHMREMAKLRALRGREDRITRMIEGAGAGDDAREEVEAIKLGITEDFAQLGKVLQEQNRKSILHSSQMNQSLAQLLLTLHTGDLEEEPMHDTIRLTLERSFIERIIEMLKRELREQYREDILLIKTALERCRDKTRVQVEALTGNRAALGVHTFDENGAWEAIRDALVLEINYRGEMPKRGFLQRLGEGRQAMFLAMMVISLGGTVAGGNLRQYEWYKWLMWTLPVVFVVGVVLSFKSWREADESRMHRELDRVRDQLNSELKRLIGDLQREKLTRIQDVIEASRREIARRVDVAVREYSTAKQERVNRLRQEGREKLRNLDQRSRDVQGLSSGVSRLRQMSSDIDRDIGAGLREIAKSGSVV